MAWNQIYPASLRYKDALLSTESGTSAVPWVFKRITHPQGWMATVILGKKYNLTFQDASHLTNLSYRYVGMLVPVTNLSYRYVGMLVPVTSLSYRFIDMLVPDER